MDDGTKELVGLVISTLGTLALEVVKRWANKKEEDDDNRRRDKNPPADTDDPER